LDYAIEGIGIQKSFVKHRRIDELVRHPFRRPERIHALRGVDLRVRTGEIFTLLGPNGAGKTTLLKILSCLVLPDRGRALIGGHDTVDEYAVKHQIGLVHSDERSFYWRLSGRENLRFFARLYDVPRRSTESRIGELLERVDMVAAADRPFSDYSSGMKQRMAIARALLHDPPILLMDEPTRSLDPASSMTLRRFILDELKRRDGKTIMLATHDLREAETLADRVSFLVEGKVRREGTVEQIKSWGVQERRFVLEIDTGSTPPDSLFRVESDQTSDGVRRLVVVLEPGTEFGDVMRALLGAGVTIRSCGRVEPDLEDAFSRILDDDGGERA